MSTQPAASAAEIYARASAVVETARRRGQFAPAEAAAHIETLGRAIMDLATLAGALRGPA